MKRLALAIAIIALTVAGAGAAEPTCQSGDKIADARCMLLKRGIRDWRSDLAYIYSIDENRGKFRDGEALAKWIEWGDQ